MARTEAPKVMTDAEIKKALEYHSNTDIATCKDCPMKHISKCGYKLSKLALDLINRQQAEIERLEKQFNSKYKWENMLDKKIKEVKTEAIKEFAERLKYEGYRFMEFGSGWKISISEIDIDNLVKEMAGDAK